MQTDIHIRSLQKLSQLLCLSKNVGTKGYVLLRFSVVMVALFFLMGTINKPVSAQTGSITGTVIDENTEEPLIGVNIVIAGTQQGAATNTDGNYTISGVEPGTYTLRASYIGYQRMKKTDVTVEAGESITVNFALTSSAETLEEMVVVGYGEQEAASVSGSIDEVEMGDIEEVSVANNTDKLAGRVSGLVTRQTSGLPGADSRNLNIRGFGDALVLVDGVEQSLSTIDPNSIESISVLKDASAAIYGARAGNGVILVKTRRGREGQPPQFNYKSTLTAQTPTRRPEQVTAGQYIEMSRQADLMYGELPSFTEEEMQKYKNEEPGYESYDWYDELFQPYTPQQEHNLNVQGGTEDVTYFISGGYLDQGSAVRSGDVNFERWNGRSNLDIDVSDDIQASLDLSYRRELRERPGLGLFQIWNFVQTARPMYNPDFPDTNLAEYSGKSTRSPVAMSQREKAGFQENRQDHINGRVNLDYEMPGIEGLVASGELSYYFESHHEKTFSKTFDTYRYDRSNDEYINLSSGQDKRSSVSEDFYRSQRFKPVLQFEYKNSFGPHSIDGLALSEWIIEDNVNIGASRDDLLSTELPYLFVGSDANKDNYGYASEAGRHSYVGRLNYNYDERYILSATFRADASHKFPKDSRWGYFPGISAAWRLSEEAFLEGSVFDNLKLRVSYSETGDDDVGAFQHIAGYNIANEGYIIDGNVGRRISTAGVPNPNITWRENTQYNMGVDLTVWEGQLSFKGDVFYRITDGRFGTPQRDIPSTVGAQLSQVNINKTADRGFDLKVTHENRIGEVRYSVSANTGFTRRKRVEWAEEAYEEDWEKRVYKQEGKWVRRTVGYVAVGTFRDQEEIDNWDIDQDQEGNKTLKPGDIKYKDIDGDGEITVRDQKKIGDGGEPNLSYGLDFNVQYKGFNISGLLQGASMFNKNITFRYRGGFANDGVPYSFHYENRWTEENKDAKLPAPVKGQAVNTNNSRNSTFWLKDATYLRLKNFNIGYTVPDRLVTALGIRELRFHVSGTNLLTFDRLGIYSDSLDPEAGGWTASDGRHYPLHKTFSFGVNLSL